MYTNPSRATIPLIRPHQCDSEGGRIRGVLLYFEIKTLKILDFVPHSLKVLIIYLLTIYHQGFFDSVMRNHGWTVHRRRSLAILGHAGLTWRMRLSLHLVSGLPCRLVHSPGVHSVTLIVHLLSLNRAMCPTESMYSLLETSMMSFTSVCS